jgi:hypothetical protein
MMKPTNKFLRVALLVGLIGGCAALHKSGANFALQPGQKSPAAEGKLNVKKASGNNEKLTLKVQHLAEPSAMAPGMTTYVAWIDAGPKHPVQPLGALKVNDKKREGEIEALTPFKTFDIYVTAENSATPAKPSQYVVLQGRIDTTNRIID